MECSAKENWNIKEMMKTFLSLAKINLPTDEGTSLRRRSSAHASSVSKFRLNNLTPHIIPELIIDALTNPTSSDDNPIQKHLNGELPTTSNGVNGHQSTSNLNLSTTNGHASTSTSADETSNNHMSLGQRLKPRSRSLIRRTSKKVNKVKDTSTVPEDCYIQ